MPKYRLIFVDGTTETVEMPFRLWVAWFKGRIRAREKGTHLLKVEEESVFGRLRELSVGRFGTVKGFRVKYIDLTTGRTVEKTISEVEQFDLYRQQREGKISIISIETIK